MTPKNDIVPGTLEELSFAPAGYPWDEAGAFERLKNSFGFGSLAAYSIRVDTLKDPGSQEAYPMLVVDLIDGEPLIVPRALESAGRKALALEDEEERNFVLERVEELESRSTSNKAESPESAREREKERDREELRDDQPNVVLPRIKGVQGAQPAASDLMRAENLVAKMRSEGKILAAWGVDALKSFIAGLSAEPSIPDNNSEPISPYDFFVRLLESLPTLVPMDEFAKPAAKKDDSMESLGRKIASALNRSTGRSA